MIPVSIAGTVGKYALAVLLAGLVTFGATFLACGKSRSPLVKDDAVPRTCKYILEALYYDEKDKSGFATFGEGCKAAEGYIFCRDQTKGETDPRDKKHAFELCLAKHGK